MLKYLILFVIANFFIYNTLSITTKVKIPKNKIAQISIEDLPDEIILHIINQSFDSIINTSNNIEEAINNSLEFIKTVRLISYKYNNFLLDLVKSLNKALLESNKFKQLLNKKFKLIIIESENLNKAIKKSLDFIKNIKLRSNIFTDFKAYLYRLFKESIYNSNFFNVLKNKNVGEKDIELFKTIIEEDLLLDVKCHKISFLIDAGADINAQNICGRTPLISAIHNHFQDLAILLINNGADINIEDWFDATSLMYAAKINNIKITKELIAKGASINAKNIFNKTALIYAVTNSNITITKLLLDHGADISTVDYEQNTALDIALKIGNKAIISLIQEKIK